VKKLKHDYVDECMNRRWEVEHSPVASQTHAVINSIDPDYSLHQVIGCIHQWSRDNNWRIAARIVADHNIMLKTLRKPKPTPRPRRKTR
jgi:hypothetical protein